MHVHCCNTLFPYNFLSLLFIINPMAFKIRFCNISCSYWWLCFMHCNEKSFLVVHSTIYFSFSLFFVSFLFEVWLCSSLCWCYYKMATFNHEKSWTHHPCWWIWKCTYDKEIFVCNVLSKKSHKSMNVVC